MDLTDDQARKVAALKERLQKKNVWDDNKHDAYALRRFLKARNWDVHEAEKMWVNMVAWRRESGADTMLDHEVLSEQKRRRLNQIFPHGLHGTDLKGRPILIYHMGVIDLDAVAKEFTDKELKQFHIQVYEFIMRVALPACSLQAGKHVDTVTNIFDLKGVGFWTLSKLRAMFIPTMAITRDNYPETLGQVIVINAPSFFDNAYNLGKHMLTAETQAKIQVVGKHYQPVLDKLIAKDQLPRHLGGTSDHALAENHGPWSKLIAQAQHQSDGKTRPDEVAASIVESGAISAEEFQKGTAPGKTLVADSSNGGTRPDQGHPEAAAADKANGHAGAPPVGANPAGGSLPSGLPGREDEPTAGQLQAGMNVTGSGMAGAPAPHVAPSAGGTGAGGTGNVSGPGQGGLGGSAGGTAQRGSFRPLGGSGGGRGDPTEAFGQAQSIGGHSPTSTSSSAAPHAPAAALGAKAYPDSPPNPKPSALEKTLNTIVSPFRQAAAIVIPGSEHSGHDLTSASGAWRGERETGGDRSQLQGNSSIASFHTCISAAESLGLNSYLQKSSQGYFPSASPMNAAPQPLAITEEEAQLSGSTWTSRQMTEGTGQISNAGPGQGQKGSGAAGKKAGGCTRCLACCKGGSKAAKYE